MKSICRLLAWVFGAMTLLGLGRNFNSLSRTLPSSAVRPGAFAEAMGELTASAIMLILAVWFARLSMDKKAA